MLWLVLHLGGQRWTVWLVRAKHKHLHPDLDGVALLGSNRILISRELNPQAREDTLIHELLHAMIYVSGAGTALQEAMPDPEATEEAIVRDLTPMLHRLLKDLGFAFPKGLTQ